MKIIHFISRDHIFNYAKNLRPYSLVLTVINLFPEFACDFNLHFLNMLKLCQKILCFPLIQKS